MIEKNQPAFETGRAEAFQTIKTYLENYRQKINDYAPIFTEDSLGKDGRFKLSAEKERMAYVADHMLSYTLDYYDWALAELGAGKTVYEITGQNRISTYHPIIDGDHTAGMRAGGDDFMVMIMSFDRTALVNKTLKDLAESEAFCEDTLPAVNKLIGLCPAVLQDDLIAYTQKHFKETTRYPEHIVYAGEPEPNLYPGALKRLFNFVYDQTYRNQNRMIKIQKHARPLSLPGHKGAIRAFFSDAHGTADNDDFAAPYDWAAMPSNHSEAFCGGFKETMACLAEQIQHFHFGTKAAQGFGRTLHIGKADEKAAQDISSDICLQLRDKMHGFITDETLIRGSGQSYLDGFEAARRWTLQEIMDLERAKSQDGIIEKYIMKKVVQFYKEIIDETYLETYAPAPPEPEIDGFDEGYIAAAE